VFDRARDIILDRQIGVRGGGFPGHSILEVEGLQGTPQRTDLNAARTAHIGLESVRTDIFGAGLVGRRAHAFAKSIARDIDHCLKRGQSDRRGTNQ